MAALNKSILNFNNPTEILFDSICRGEDVGTIQALLLECVDIDARDSEGYSPLALACLYDRKEIVDLLIKSGADIKFNIKDYTVLHFASQNGWLKIVQTLMKKLPDLNKCPEYGTVLHAAAGSGHLEIVKCLVEKEADIHTRNVHGCTALHNASGQGHLDVVKYLVEKGTDINIKDKSGYTAMQVAVVMRYLEVVEYLVEKGADINAKEDRGHTALHSASGQGYLEIVKYLVEKGIIINVTDNGDCTAVRLAVVMGYLEIVKYLLEKGADINEEDNCGHTALHIASFQGHLEIVKYLLEKGSNINVKSRHEETALHNASFRGYLEIVKCLVGKRADINMKNCDLDARNASGTTALGEACKRQKFDIAQYLLQAGASWDIEDKRGKSLLNYVTRVKEPQFEFVKLFIENGAYLKHVDYEAIVKGSLLKVLQNVELCSQAIVNQFNNHDLLELYKLPASRSLPPIEQMKIASCSEVAQAIKQTVGFEIQTKGHCNILKVCPMVLSVFAVRSILGYCGKK